ncbi:MAG: nucleotidyltransferase domain-containing protein [Methanoregula sp.]
MLFLDFSKGTPPEKFEEFSRALKAKIDSEPSIQAAAIFGSFAKKEAHIKSDLDIGIIRNAGFINGVRACFFVFLLRIHTVTYCLPVDLFLADSKDHLIRFWKEKEPIVLNDKNKIFS